MTATTERWAEQPLADAGQQLTGASRQPGGAAAAVQRLAEPAPFLVVVLGFVLGMRPLDDPDIWWHLRLGLGYLHGVWPTQDTWGYMVTQDDPYVLHQWLGQLALGFGYQVAGYDGVIVLRGAAFATTLLLIVWQARKHAGPLVVTIIASLCLVGLFDFTNPRPQLFSFVFLAVVAPVWLACARRCSAPPWWIVPLMLVWANTHGLWTTALALYAVLVLTVAVSRGWRQRARWLPLLGHLAAYLAVILVNPWGWRLFLEPFVVARAAGPSIGEWQAPHMLALPTLCFVVMVVLVVVSWARAPGRVPAVEITYVLFGLLMGMAYLRTVAVGVILIAPLAARALTELVGMAPPPLPAWLATTRARLLTGAVVAATAALAGALALALTPSLPPDAPYRPAQALTSVDARAKVLCDYDLCGWLLWDAPSLRPAIDTRTEIYDPAYTASYLGAIDLAPGWEQLVDRTRADAAWLRKSRPLVVGLRDTLGWSVAYEDDWSVVLVPPTTAD